MQEIDQILNAVFVQYQQIESSTGPLAIRAIVTIIAITLYAIFAGSFYETLSKKTIFKLNLPKPLLFSEEEHHVRMWDILVLFFQYTIFFPIITLIWTMALTLFLLALSSSSPAEVAVLSLSIVASTRIVAYYDEQISVDVAKLLPIALLAIIVADPGSLSAQVILSRGSELMAVVHQFVPLFLFLMSVEWALRLALETKYFLFGHPDEDDTALDRLLTHYKPSKKNK